MGLSAMANKFAINMWKLPFKDVRPNRLTYLAEKKMQVPRPKNPKNKMTNQARINASRKQQVIPRYIDGRIFWIQHDEAKEIYQLIQARSDTELVAKNALLSAETKLQDTDDM